MLRTSLNSLVTEYKYLVSDIIGKDVSPFPKNLTDSWYFSYTRLSPEEKEKENQYLSVTAVKVLKRFSLIPTIYFVNRPQSESNFVRVCRGCPIEVIKIFLQNAINPNTREKGTLSRPLIVSSALRRYDVAELLLKYGADKDATDFNGRTAVDIARMSSDVKMEVLLVTGVLED